VLIVFRRPAGARQRVGHDVIMYSCASFRVEGRVVCACTNSCLTRRVGALAAAMNRDWCLWQAAERQALEDDLHIKLGHQLFAAAEYEQAMASFPFPIAVMWRVRFHFLCKPMCTL
jgi:hypothetical protein